MCDSATLDGLLLPGWARATLLLGQALWDAELCDSATSTGAGDSATLDGRV